MAESTPSTSLKSAIYEHIARIGRATASPHRLELLDLLAQGPRTVDALSRQTGLSLATTSHHLQALRRARLVEATKAGLYVTYRLADQHVGDFLLQLRRLAQHRIAEIDQVARQYKADRGALEAVDNEELVRRVRTGDVTVIDVRPQEEYDAGHIPGAISMPLAHLRKQAGTLPKGREIVAYCRGPYCVMALDAVTLLRRRGLLARHLELGVPEWRARGWRVDTGPHADKARRP